MRPISPVPCRPYSIYVRGAFFALFMRVSLGISTYAHYRAFALLKGILGPNFLRFPRPFLGFGALYGAKTSFFSLF